MYFFILRRLTELFMYEPNSLTILRLLKKSGIFLRYLSMLLTLPYDPSTRYTENSLRIC